MTVKLQEDQPTANSSSSEEEETDSESESEPALDSKKVETSSKPKTMANSSSPVTNSPSADSNKVQTSESTANSSSLAVNSPTDYRKVETSKKRLTEIDEGEEAKRVKRVSGDDEDKKSVDETDGKRSIEKTKKNYFQRVWTEEDEIVVLQGFIDYKNDTGSSPLDDKNALYELLKKYFSFDVTKIQFLEKIRGLKKKFENNLEKGKKKGEEPSFSKHHDRKVFNLSKFVWGDNGIVVANKVEPEYKLVEPKQESVSILQSITRSGIDDLVAKKGWSRLSSEDKIFEKEWEALQFEELKLYSQKSGIIHRAVSKMAESFETDH